MADEKASEIVFTPFAVEADDTLYTCAICAATIVSDEEAMDRHRAWHRKINSPFGGGFGSRL